MMKFDYILFSFVDDENNEVQCFDVRKEKREKKKKNNDNKTSLTINQYVFVYFVKLMVGNEELKKNLCQRIKLTKLLLNDK